MAHRLLELIAIFALLVVAGLGLRVLSRPAAGLDLRLVTDWATHRSAVATAAAHAVSLLGRSWLLIPLTAVFGLALARPLRLRGLRGLAWAPLVAVLGADALQNVVKGLVDRPRPPVAHLEHVTGSSFPSGHATESTAVLVALVGLAWARWPTRGARIAVASCGALMCAAIAASRVYLGVHYPTDVAAGIVLGAAWGTAAVAGLTRPSDRG